MPERIHQTPKKSFAENHPHMAVTLLPALLGIAYLQTRLLESRLRLPRYAEVRALETMNSGWAHTEAVVYDQASSEIIVPDGGTARANIDGIPVRIDDYRKKGQKDGGFRVRVGDYTVHGGPNQTKTIEIGEIEARLIHKLNKTLH